MTQRKNPKACGLATEHPTYIIAEIGINHGGSLDTARRLIDSAAQTGCDAVKLQTYLTEKRAPKGNQAVFDILKSCELPLDAFAGLQDHARAQGLQFFSTPFDDESVECLEAIGCDLYKVASFDVVNQALLSRLAATGKPVVMSVGMASAEELDEAVGIVRAATEKLVLLNCTSAYPMAEEDANLAALATLQERYDCIVGHSDHTPDIVVPLYAVAAGAQVIEKHYKIDSAMECVDAPVSITQEQMARLVSETRRVERMLGSGELGLKAAEEGTLPFRRSSR
ncbi:MAG: N-acetylneuraminate synthase family protein [Desulfovibrionaceae bacterium]